MELLTWLTVIYLVVLVATLAVGLILILLALRGIGGKLAKIGAGLKLVESHTAPLNASVEALNNGLGTLAGGLQVAENSFASANEHFQEALDSVAAITQ
ncbi:MAG: hypothetical protein ABIU20_05340 [Blastocatellia bacterium]